MIYVPISQPIRIGASWDERWAAYDKGLIAAWEEGRRLSFTNCDLATRARQGQLVELPWKGGVSTYPKPLKPGRTRKPKRGSYLYLAMWQGLRGVDLAVDTEFELTLTCALFQVEVMYSSAAIVDDETDEDA